MTSMHGVQLTGLDLNLLVVLDALLEERVVTRAAKRVGLSQSATSHALARLREALGDPLLVRGPRGAMVRTPRAEALELPLRRALEEIARAVAGEPVFDPATARRTFTIATSDCGELVVLPPLLARLSREAPAIDLWVRPADHVATLLAEGLVDVGIAPARSEDTAPGLYQQRLFDERFVCVVRAGHPVRRLTLKRYVSMPHALIAPRGMPGSFVDDALAKLGETRRIALLVPHFLVAPHLVARSDLVLTLAARVAATLAPMLDLRVMEPPLELPGLTMSLLWHERAHRDPAHQWLRGLIVDASRV